MIITFAACSLTLPITQMLCFTHSRCYFSGKEKKNSSVPLTNHTGGIQFQLRTLTALFADSRDYELLVLAMPAFTNSSGEAKGGGHIEVGWGENGSFRRCTASKRCFFCPQRPLLSNQKVRCQNLALPCIAPPSFIFTHTVAHHPHPFICLHTSLPSLSLSLSLTQLLTGGFYCPC